MSKQDKIKELLTRGVQSVIIAESLAKKLSSGKKLRVKLGVDPTSPLLHLGHTVVLRKLKQFQDLGHQVIFLVGDFTGRVGDPSDKLAARKPLTDKEIKKNVETYKAQVGKVLDLSRVEIHYNMEWYGDMDLAELVQLMSLFSANQMLERDMFQKRIQMKRPVWLHELLYPVLQGYDSVALRADVELGGTDQTFNMLTARTIQPSYSQLPQDIITAQLLEGTDGKEKMSKSIGNTINLDDAPQDMYGKTMAIPDKLIAKYFRLLTDVPEADIRKFESAMTVGNNPRDYKARLALELVTMYHGKSAATAAEKDFKKTFTDRQAPDAMPVYKSKPGNYGVIDILITTKLAASKSEARRLIEQGAIEIDGMVKKDWQEQVVVQDGTVVKAGKRKFVKLVK
jgi:tyrosyl-tRNA synthetase